MSEAFRLLSDDELEPQARELLAGLPDLNVIRAAAGAPTVLSTFIDTATALLAHTELAALEWEVAVVRPAHNAGSAYVWHQHDRISRLLGKSRTGSPRAATAAQPRLTRCCAAPRTNTRPAASHLTPWPHAGVSSIATRSDAGKLGERRQLAAARPLHPAVTQPPGGSGWER